MGSGERRQVQAVCTSEVPVSLLRCRHGRVMGWWATSLLVLLLVVACSDARRPEAGGGAVSISGPSASVAAPMPESGGAEGAVEDGLELSRASDRLDGSAAPTSEWVVFEEVEPEVQWPVLDEVRVPQAETDDQGPGYWFSSMELPSEYALEEEGISIEEFLAPSYAVDLCDPDASVARFGPADQAKVMELIAQRGLAEAAECPEPGGDDDSAAGPVGCVVIRADGRREACPEPEPPPEPVVDGEARWLAVDECARGVWGQTYRTMLAAYRSVAADRVLRTLPHRARPLGFRSEVQDHLPCQGIEWVAQESQPAGMEVLVETVSVNGGTLRGLARNLSDTLWAWDVEVHASTNSFEWPLTVQPGEVAGFEFPNWDGPSDPGLIEFSISADMSEDADLSRGFEIGRSMSPFVCDSDLAGHGGILAVPDEYRDEILAGAGCLDQLWAFGRYRGGRGQSAAHVGLGSPSHPSMRGRMAPGLVADLRVYGAHIDDDGRVADLKRLTPFSFGGFAVDEGPKRDADGNHLISPAQTFREYPPLDVYDRSLTLLLPSRWQGDFVVWIGGAH